MKILERSATTYGGRDGIIKDTLSNTELKLGKPQEMGGKLTRFTNPEELFSMGYSSCFASSLEFLLQKDGQKYEDVEVTVTTSLETSEDGFKFKIKIDAKVYGLPEELSKKYIDGAYNFCPYSKAIRNNVEVEFA